MIGCILHAYVCVERRMIDLCLVAQPITIVHDVSYNTQQAALNHILALSPNTDHIFCIVDPTSDIICDLPFSFFFFKFYMIGSFEFGSIWLFVQFRSYINCRDHVT